MFTTSEPIFRYTPPTCTLDIWLKSSFWGGKNKQKNLEKLSFELRFDDPRLPEDQQVSIKGDRSQLEALCDVVHSYVQYLLKQPSNAIPIVSLNPEEIQQRERENNSIISLKTQSLFAHELYLGNLKNEISEKRIKLSATQLFDLANALENYQDEIESLQVFKPKNNPQKIIFLGSIAATILLAVGLNTGLIKVFPQSQQLAEKESNTPENPYPVPGVEIQPPAPPSPVNIPSPSVPLILKNIQRLPPPPPVQAPVQAPVQPSTVTKPNNVVPNVGIIAIKPAVNPPILPSNTNRNSNRNSQEKPTPKPQASADLTPNIPPPPPLKPSSLPSVKLEPQSNLPTPTFDVPKPRQKPTSVPTFAAEANTDIATNNIPNNQIINNSEIPQISEIKNYFKEKWQPKENIQQTLEYRLSIDSNGALNRITPIGQASKINLDNTGMPLLGESFVSPLINQDSATIRLVLHPDGTVQTFRE